MADVDIDPFRGHDRTESRPEENIPLDLVTPGVRSIWEPKCEEDTSFRGESQRTNLIKDYVKIYMKSYPKKLVKSQNHFTTITLNLKVGNYTT